MVQSGVPTAYSHPVPAPRIYPSSIGAVVDITMETSETVHISHLAPQVWGFEAVPFVELYPLGAWVRPDTIEMSWPLASEGFTPC